MNFIKNKSQNKALDPSLADRMLQNVFSACGDDGNSVPLEVLASCDNYHKERFRLQKTLLIAIIILFCILPVFFITPTITVTENAVPEYPSIYMIQVDAPLPVRKVMVYLNGTPLYVTDAGNSTYYIHAGTDGELTVTAILRNRQYTTETIQITTTKKQ